MFQKTLKEAVEFRGIGLHTGAKVKLRVLPAERDSSIVFIRKDLPGAPVIKAVSGNVVETGHSTTLRSGSATVRTVEHLLGSLYGLGIDNAAVEVWGPEVPILDGSALGFVEKIERAGIKRLNVPKKYLLVKKPVKVLDGTRFVYLEPGGDLRFSIDYTIDFFHPRLKRQSMVFSFSMEFFKKEVTGARTFGFLKDIMALKAAGLAKGGSLENAIVVGEDEILNKEGLRFPDEFVRHKVLDLIGDISLVAMPIAGRVTAFRAGHALNCALVRKILESPDCWKRMEFFDSHPARDAQGSPLS
jgi:UDP-3-O-[3-hydroxymyristoyl] N-acetylglucosamine deacetylase